MGPSQKTAPTTALLFLIPFYVETGSNTPADIRLRALESGRQGESGVKPACGKQAAALQMCPLKDRRWRGLWRARQGLAELVHFRRKGRFACWDAAPSYGPLLKPAVAMFTDVGIWKTVSVIPEGVLKGDEAIATLTK